MRRRQRRRVGQGIAVEHDEVGVEAARRRPRRSASKLSQAGATVNDSSAAAAGIACSGRHGARSAASVRSTAAPSSVSGSSSSTGAFGPPSRAGLSAPSQVLEVWADEFDRMDRHVDGGPLTVCTHPQVVGRGHRMAMLERHVEHGAAAGARFARMAEIAGELQRPALTSPRAREPGRGG